VSKEQFMEEAQGCPLTQRAVGRRAWLACAAGAGAPWLAGLAGCITTGGGGGPAPGDYADAMRQALKSVTGELPGYLFRASPIGNFGVGSIYLDEVAGGDLKQVESSWFLGGPDTWLSPAIIGAERQQSMSRLVAEGSMGSFNLASGGAREVHAQAGVALITSLVGVEAGVDARRGLNSRVDVSEVRHRRLNWAEFDAALRAGRIAPEVADIVRRGRFVVAAADIVLVGYRAEISVDEQISPRVAAGLRAKTLPVARANASFSVTEQARGRFAIAASQPVVAAVMFKQPPKVVPKDGPPPGIDAWPAAPVDAERVQSLEAKVLQRR